VFHFQRVVTIWKQLALHPSDLQLLFCLYLTVQLLGGLVEVLWGTVESNLDKQKYLTKQRVLAHVCRFNTTSAGKLMYI
jgi:hypothetical protein